MKSKIFILAALMAAVSFWSCKTDTKSQEKATTNTETTSKAKSCKYKIKSSDVKVNWTAYKTTKRVGVKGTFDSVDINTVAGTPSLSALMLGTSFRIDTKTVNSDNPGRDEKLVNFFFGKMTGNLGITGQVKSVEGDDAHGKGVVTIVMNGVTTDNPFEYTIADKVLTLTTSINTDNWNAQAAISSINKACEEKHRGEDGISKTWPDVDVSVVVPLEIECE